MKLFCILGVAIFLMAIPMLATVNAQEQEDEKYYVNVDKMPKFPGGDVELRKYIATNVNYPEGAKAKKIEGKVYVRFAVNPSGNVVKPPVARGVHPLLDDEAIRVVKSLPKWEPGSHRGEPVSVWFLVPVTFRLE